MLRRPSAPRKRAFLGKIFKGITRALGLGEKKAPSVTVDMSAMTKMAPSRPRTAIRRTPRGDRRDMVIMMPMPPEAQTIMRQE